MPRICLDLCRATNRRHSNGCSIVASTRLHSWETPKALCARLMKRYTTATASGPSCKVPTRPFSQAARKVVLRRTSEHWWEDEEEFDAITEVVVPKRLYLVAAAPPPPSPALPAADVTAAGETSWGPVSDTTLGNLLTSSGGKFACGFSSTKLRTEAEILWRRLQQDGPPFFKKVRTRTTLNVLEDAAAAPAAVRTAAEELWVELCGQTWRVELDYGLEGSVAEPRDDLLLACSWLAASRFLDHAGLSTYDNDVAQRAGVCVVHVSGYKASEQGTASGAPLPSPRTWRDLRPGLQPLAVAASAATAAAPS